MKVVELTGHDDFRKAWPVMRELQRAGAHRFYEERMGYDRVSYCFTKPVG